MKILRTPPLIFLPLIALALGWHLGASYQMKHLTGEQQRIVELFSISSGSGQTVKTDPEKEVDITLFWSVWRLLSKHYIEPEKLETKSMVFGAVSGMVSAIGDPYTLFMTPQDTKIFESALSGTLEGIGAQLDLKDRQVLVVAPIKGSPAEKAGLQPKDLIVSVDGKSVEGMALENVVSMIRGPKGTFVTLEVKRASTVAMITITVVRDAIHIPSVESKVIATATGSIGYVALNQFGDDSVAELKKAISSFPKEGLKGVVLDLRFNGGGYLEGAVDLVSMFLEVGDVVTVEHRENEPEIHRVTGSSILPDMPLVVLINGGSASASEIAAGALQDHKRAKIIGTQSFGKGTVQEIIELPGGSSLRVTVAHWLTPAGQDLGKKGVTPDIVVDRTVEQYQSGYDPQLLAAEVWLTEHEDVSGGKKTATGSVK
ncbi:S41 family peptidase [Candidatus Peribacteria bacterium]|nr:S41 family peptidase [Candidatus Peribacteria bacterium]